MSLAWCWMASESCMTKTKNKDGKARQVYYQTIARYLFELRGAPFFLSPREMEALGRWEERGIPLEAVLDGLKLAYERFRKKPGGRKKLTLVFCEPQVLQSFDQHQERRVGTRRNVFSQDEKLSRLRQVITEFLDGFPEEIDCLNDLFIHVAAELAKGDCDEERLELYDQQVEKLLLDFASRSEKETVAAELMAEHPVQDREELERLVRIKLLKNFRDRYKIPHLSLFYY
jgi:hypothetical protein